jgi:hypothetical protein
VPGVFVIARDARGSLVHVRERATGECVGCLESALYEIVRMLVLEERDGRRREEGELCRTRDRLSRSAYDDGG